MIRKMQESDLKAVLQIEQAVFPDPWDENAFLYELKENPYSHYWVAVTEETVIGFMGIWTTFDSAQITNIAVLPAYGRKGYGQQLMDEAIRTAEASDCEFLSLEVRVSNEKAIRFYQKNGFDTVTVKKGYYHNNYEDAYYMLKALQVK